ncbi:protein of unknown function [Desulfacinum hydrothermale DSM 13146]|uniref:DNA repair photolyase n=1 Tax=Desulfacinum hydrothermale DSM 13146 TaxID=1121390 RepID=A0A1W1XGB6_9BACT|nr:DUF1848 family protein [Desulfacinum hydrothermale]SMC23023.1 protein of unknown function [Desulfacinum hydrothermale DSM 13146]
MIVLSASRRTDIPAFYMDQFMAGIRAGAFEVENPYNGRVSRVAATPDEVAAVVFWSKNYHAFLEGGYGLELQRRGYRLFFHFTVNSPHRVLEPHLPDLEDRLAQVRRLTELVPPQAVNWRFDPILWFRDERGETGNNLGDFVRIAEGMARAGVRTCTTSFLDIYPKVRRRAAGVARWRFLEVSRDKRLQVLRRMLDVLNFLGMELQVCCEEDLVEALGLPDDVRSGACVSHARLEEIYGPLGLSHRRDKGQRSKAGCGCDESRDVGSYRRQPCWHGCLYCYANPVRSGGRRGQGGAP